MVEQAHARKCHDNAVFVRGLDDVVVADRSAGLGDILHAGFPRALDVVPEGEERVRPDGDAGLGRDPSALFLRRQRFGLFRKDPLPLPFAQNVLVLIRGIDVDGVVAVRAADVGLEGQREHLRVLPQEPVVRLLPGQARAVDAALLSGADADGLAVFHIADGVGLGILQRDERD